MLSRVGDRIYWMSRLMERAENMARILGVTSNVVLCSTPETQQQNLLASLTITGTTGAYFDCHKTISLSALIDFMGLDVKYHILLPRVEDVGGALDYYQWAALLKSVSSFETYRIIYRDQIRPINVAELLILDRRMPRSLAACMEQIDAALSRVEGQNDHSAKRL